jgi:hypothetical protein
MTKTMHGVIHGKTIVLAEDPGIADGEKVEVMVRDKQLPGPPAGWFPGCKETAGGMLAETWTDEDDRILQEIYEQRKRNTRQEADG